MSMNVNENGDITRITTNSENALTNVAIDRPYIIPVTDVNTITIPQEFQERLREIEELINQQRNYQYQQIIMNHYQELSNPKNNKSNNISGITNPLENGNSNEVKNTIKKESKMTYKMETCPCCGKKRRTYNLIELENGKKVCRECYNRCFARDCFDTTKRIQIREPGTYRLLENIADVYIGYGLHYTTIEKAKEMGYFRCPKCGKWHKTNMIIETVDGRKLCLNCAKQLYFKCEDCGKWKPFSDKVGERWDGQNICKECASVHYFKCERCGRYHKRELRRNYNGETICQNCYRNLMQNIIHSYHDNCVRYIKRNTPEDLPLTNNTCYFGFELEVSGDKMHAKDFLETQNIKSDVVLMSDSSIKGGGFEIVSMPMTKNYINAVFIPKFAGALKFLRDNDFKGHNYGGLHIHISQDAVTNKQLAQLGEILYGNDRDRKIWLGITQRKAYEMNSWSKMTNKYNSFYSISELPEENGKAEVGSPRYSALIRDNRTKTYEFRIFNSNLRIERFLKNYECVLALLDYTKEHEQNVMPICNTIGFIEYVYSHPTEYENLYKFFVERQIKEHYKNGYLDSEIERAA